MFVQKQSLQVVQRTGERRSVSSGVLRCPQVSSALDLLWEELEHLQEDDGFSYWEQRQKTAGRRQRSDVQV